jgi:hypothetical protein
VLARSLRISFVEKMDHIDALKGFKFTFHLYTTLRDSKKKDTDGYR